MFAPPSCPCCHQAERWHKVEDFLTGFTLFGFIRFGGLRHTGQPILYKYRCDACGYEAKYDDRAETLGR